MKSIALFISGEFGLELIDLVARNPNSYLVHLIVINGEDKYSTDYHNQVLAHPYVLRNQTRVKSYSEGLLLDEEIRGYLGQTSLGISALFGHVFPAAFLENISFKLINLHPSLLPIGRGSDPVAWGIIEDRDHGSTIHEIDAGLDSGKIVSQERIFTDLSMTAGEVYLCALSSLKSQLAHLLENEFLDLRAKNQDGPASYHKSSQLRELREGLITNGADLEKSVRIIQALTFNDGRAARVKLANGEIWELRISCTRIVSEDLECKI
jgi:methionyl-tRNA formyltransferase